MAEAITFEVRPVAEGLAVVGESVTFKRQEERLFALNEDSETFAVVPRRYAALLSSLADEGRDYCATVADYNDRVPVIELSFFDNDKDSIAVAVKDSDKNGMQTPIEDSCKDGTVAPAEHCHAKSNEVLAPPAAQDLVVDLDNRFVPKEQPMTGNSSNSNLSNEGAVPGTPAHAAAGTPQSGNTNKKSRGINKTYKVIIGIAVCIVCIAFFALCFGESQSPYVSDSMFELGEEAVEITEAYLDGSMSASEARGEMEDVYDRASLRYDALEEPLDNDFFVKLDILGLEMDLSSLESAWLLETDTTDETVSEDLEELKDDLYR